MKKILKSKFIIHSLNLFLIMMLIFSQTFHLIELKPIDGKNKEKFDGSYDLSLPKSSEGGITISGSDWESIPGSGGLDSPFLIENRVIDGNGGNGITISDSTHFFIIRNCTITNVNTGIFLDGVASGTAKIYNNTISNCRGTGVSKSGIGIHLYYTDGAGIINNTVYDILAGTKAWSGNGIQLELSHYNTIHNNIIYDINSGSTSTTGRGNGIYLISSLYNVVSQNKISECSSASQLGTYSGNGIYNLHGDYNNYVNNTVSEIYGGTGRISGNGIVLVNAYGNTVGNIVDNNSISEVIGGNSEYSGNGVLVVAEDDRLVESTQVINIE
jgi:hypothetical protein